MGMQGIGTAILIFAALMGFAGVGIINTFIPDEAPKPVVIAAPCEEKGAGMSNENMFKDQLDKSALDDLEHNGGIYKPEKVEIFRLAREALELRTQLTAATKRGDEWRELHYGRMEEIVAAKAAQADAERQRDMHKRRADREHLDARSKSERTDDAEYERDQALAHGAVMREALEKVRKGAERVSMDHACLECGGSIPVDGFQCWYHATESALSTPAPEALEKLTEQILKPIQDLVDAQAKCEGLWFEHKYITEDYLQRALRDLHSVVEKAGQK